MATVNGSKDWKLRLAKPGELSTTAVIVSSNRGLLTMNRGISILSARKEATSQKSSEDRETTEDEGEDHGLHK